MTDAAFAAVDLGASSGRVILGHVHPGPAGRPGDPGRLELVEVNRFPNIPVRVAGTLHWDILALYRGILDGLRAAGREARALAGVGIDSWAVDYALLDASNELLGNPVHYRDQRTDGIMTRVSEQIPPAELYAVTGIQALPFNTINQLVAAQGSTALAAASTLLLIPDLIAFWLTGVQGAEVTNASTTQLLDARRRRWATPLMRQLGIPAGLFPPLRDPGANCGELTAEVLAETGLAGPVRVTAVGSHDTASAVVGVPASTEHFAYISCGTWSLVGLELPEPVLTNAARAANFTNESGVDSTVRFLRNVMGLWLLQESVRTWNEHGLPADLETLLHDAARVPAFAAIVDPDDPAFLTPGEMPARIARACVETGQVPPQNQAETVRCILDSLALAYRATLREAQELTDRSVQVVHIVGGGARNALLCQLTADACGLPVVAGPVEAAALGNILVQARAAGIVAGGLSELRAWVAASVPLAHYHPAGDPGAWSRAAARFAELRGRSLEPA